MKRVDETVIKPTIAGLKREGIAYKGFIFIGLMNVDGEPYVIEYNARMGDPETQVVLPRITSDLVELLVAAGTGTINNVAFETDKQHAVTISMVSGGYPGDYEKGKEIKGLENIGSALTFHAGTKIKDKIVITDGGRVIAMTGMGVDLKTARENAYLGASKLCWEGLYFRKDIGLDLLTLVKN
jgi:phosphoribosylamine--glycine ligase